MVDEAAEQGAVERGGERRGRERGVHELEEVAGAVRAVGGERREERDAHVAVVAPVGLSLSLLLLLRRRRSHCRRRGGGVGGGGGFGHLLGCLVVGFSLLRVSLSSVSLYLE